MKSELMLHKDFHGSAAFSAEDVTFHGKIEGINDLVAYESDTAQGLQAAFQEAVESYLAQCAEAGKPALPSVSGAFNVRVGEELHRLAIIAAKRRGTSLNRFIRDLLEERLAS